MEYKVVSPILGFEEIKSFSLEEVDSFFSKLSADKIAFTLINPFLLREYDFSIPLFYKQLLEVQDNDDLAVYTTVVVDTQIEKSTVNFLAPIIINKNKKLIAQVALDSSKYPNFSISESIEAYL